MAARGEGRMDVEEGRWEDWRGKKRGRNGVGCVWKGRIGKESGGHRGREVRWGKGGEDGRR